MLLAGSAVGFETTVYVEEVDARVLFSPGCMIVELLVEMFGILDELFMSLNS